MVADRFERSAPISIAGGRTALPEPAPGDPSPTVLSTSGLTRIVDYPARDLTITVEAGLRFEELQRVLQAQGQCLPIDAPEAHRATVGGVLAADVSGPSRFGRGTLRDYLIGVRAVDGQGRLFAAGGRVVKNVAGYDLCKLLIGSQGRLAVIAEATFKLWPRAETRRLVWAQLPGWAAAEQALAGLIHTATRPVAVELCNPPAAAQLTRESKLAIPESGVVLCIGYEGTDRETEWQATTLLQEWRGVPTTVVELIGPDDADDLWSALTEFPAASDAPVTLQAAVLPSRLVDFAQQADARGLAVLAHAGNGVLIGHLPDESTEAAPLVELLADLRARARAAQGDLQVLRCEPIWRSEAAAAISAAVSPLEHRIKAALDPRGILNPAAAPSA